VPNTHCSIPKGISPGDADFNNEFDLSNLEVQHLKIFNRYGWEVYDKANYVNEWHGQSKSGELPTGTYYYEVTLSKGKRVTGWVYLQRAVN
jgi:gliding motility-associated-like protein